MSTSSVLKRKFSIHKEFMITSVKENVAIRKQTIFNSYYKIRRLAIKRVRLIKTPSIKKNDFH